MDLMVGWDSFLDGLDIKELHLSFFSLVPV